MQFSDGEQDGEFFCFCKEVAVCGAAEAGDSAAEYGERRRSRGACGAEDALHGDQELVCFVPGGVVPDPGQQAGAVTDAGKFKEEHAGEEEGDSYANAEGERKFGSTPMAGETYSGGKLHEQELGLRRFFDEETRRAGERGPVAAEFDGRTGFFTRRSHN